MYEITFPPQCAIKKRKKMELLTWKGAWKYVSSYSHLAKQSAIDSLFYCFLIIVLL